MNDRDVTASVVGGTYATPRLDPGATFGLTVRIRVLRPRNDTTFGRYVAGISRSDPTKVDVVRTRVHVL